MNQPRAQLADVTAGGMRLREFAGDPSPSVAIVSGSGLAPLAEAFDATTTHMYADIPGFTPPSIEGHPGQLVLATAGLARVWLCLGRPHFYEHGDMAPIVSFVRTLTAAGIRTLILTNAAGAIDPGYRTGDVVVIDDHIFLPGLAGHHPLLGANGAGGPRFPSMQDAYDGPLSGSLADALAAAGLTVRRGVYAMVSGPSYETAAEVMLLRSVGVHAVGMSTAPEAVVARHAGMRVAAISVITNAAAGVGDTHGQVIQVTAEVAQKLGRALRAVVEAGV